MNRFFRILLSSVLLLALSSKVFAKSKNKTKNEVQLVLEEVFKKPAFINSNMKDFKGFNKKRALEGSLFDQKSYLSHYFKLKEIGIVEYEHAVSLVREHDLVKTKTPVYGDDLPKGVREQYITAVLKVPKKFKKERVDRVLRTYYGRGGDLRIHPTEPKIIISDWLSNVARMKSILQKM